MTKKKARFEIALALIALFFVSEAAILGLSTTSAFAGAWYHGKYYSDGHWYRGRFVPVKCKWPEICHLR